MWRQQRSMTVHLVNLTNPMMMKGPIRELIPVDAEVSFSVPENTKPAGVHLLMSGKKPLYQIRNGRINLKVQGIMDHEIIGVDLV